MLAQGFEDGVKLAVDCSGTSDLCPIPGWAKEEMGRVSRVSLEVTVCVAAAVFQLTGLAAPSEMDLCV